MFCKTTVRKQPFNQSANSHQHEPQLATEHRSCHACIYLPLTPAGCNSYSDNFADSGCDSVTAAVTAAVIAAVIAVVIEAVAASVIAAVIAVVIAAVIAVVISAVIEAVKASEYDICCL